MDWLKGMNNVIKYIDDNLTHTIKYESLAGIVGCSVYEFSRIFSFMTGISVSEYIRRRKLSQAALDIKNGSEKIIDIALKYCYESPTSFTRAFKELHGVAPLSARKMNTPVKTYPAITFTLIIKGAIEMNFRIEQKDSFKIMGLAGYEEEKPIPCDLDENLTVTPLWNDYLKNYNSILWNESKTYYTEPFWQIGAYFTNITDNGKTKTIIGAEYKGEMPDGINDIETIPASKWVVFSINSTTGYEKHCEAYTRILTEWFPANQYKRNEELPCISAYPLNKIDSDFVWEMWIPIVDK